MLLLCLMLSVKIVKRVQGNGENSSIREIFSEKSSRFREPPPSSYLPEFCCWKRWIWITNTAKQISSVAIMGLWPLCGCSHPPCSPTDSSLFALAMFSHRFLPLYLHNILLLLPNIFLIIAIFCKGWSWPSHLQETTESKNALKCHGHLDRSFAQYPLRVPVSMSYLAVTWARGQLFPCLTRDLIYLWNPKNNNTRRKTACNFPLILTKLQVKQIFYLSLTVLPVYLNYGFLLFDSLEKC